MTVTRAFAPSAAALIALVAATRAAEAQTAPMQAARAATASAGATAKRPLDQSTYDSWRAIQGPALSPDGRWAAYTLTPAVGDGQVVVRATSGATEYRVPRGYTGRPQLVPNADSGFTAPPASFSADGRWVAFLAYAPQATFDAARREKRKPADQPKASLALLSTADGKIETVPRVRSFRMPKESARWIAYLLEPTDSAQANRAARDSTAKPAAGGAAATPGGTARPVASDSTKKPGEKKKDYGSTLVLRDLASGAETRVDDVLAYAFTDSGTYLGYTISSRTPDRDGAYVRALSSGATVALASGRGDYKQLTFDRAGRQVAFVSDRDTYSSDRPRYALYHARLGAGAARALVRQAAFGDSVIVSDRGRVEFTRDGSAVAFGVAPVAPDSVPADSLADKAVFDLWTYRDARLQPQQRIEAARDRDRAYTAVVRLGGRERPVRLASDSFPQVTLADDGRVALAVTSVPYSIESMWGDDGSDVYLVDAATGRRTPVAKRVEFGALLSPAGRYVVWFDKGHWRSRDAATGREVDMTAPLHGVRFDQETWDTPSTPVPWGVGGWTPGDHSVLVYDRFDVWELDPSGARAPKLVTDSAGVRGHLQMRVVSLDPDARYVHPAKPLLLRAFDVESKAGGFWTARLDQHAAPARIVMADAAYGTPLRARKADVYLVTRGTFRDFPDLYAGSSLGTLARLSDANPEQRDYAWASAELVRWQSNDGRPLQGVLYKPDDYDPAKKYPMLVYFYERLSDNLHQYTPPTGRNVINPVVYASHGYVVFFPDIAYTTGYPGPNALSSIVPGVQSLIAAGIADPARIGIAGQSWGGYQVAYLVTQTNLFHAAFAGAPVANMTSAYGGIRWESGLARAFQYEHDQSRIGGSIWQYPLRYIENSPLFAADRVETPLLIMSNDADGAVPWYQGIELFVALRRLGKEVYLVNYNGDGHNPRKRANQKDVDLRMQQFFDTHLRGAPAPDWMRNGIPFLQKGRDQLGPARTTVATPAGPSSGAPAPGAAPGNASSPSGAAPSGTPR